MPCLNEHGTYLAKKQVQRRVQRQVQGQVQRQLLGEIQSQVEGQIQRAKMSRKMYAETVAEM